MLVPVGQHDGQKPLPLSRLVTLIGSSASARIFLPSKSVSRCHAAIVNTGVGMFVRDLASRTHTRVNGRVVTEADLREGDVLQVGRFTFKFTDPTAADTRSKADMASAPPPAAALEVEGLDEPLPVTGRALLIGRRETADISLTENSASSAHALIFVADGKHLLRDLKSRTGTFVNGVKVDEHALSPGDVIRVGETDFRYVPVRSGSAGDTGAGAGGGAAEVVPERIPDPEPPADVAAEPSPAPAVAGESEEKPSRASDFDFIPLELAPETAAPQTPAQAPPAPEATGANSGTSVGLLELVDSPADDGGAVQRDGGGNGKAQSPAPASAPPEPAKPARWSKSAARPSVPAPSASSRPARPLSPFDVLGDADELKPLPDAPPGPPPDDAPGLRDLPDV